MAQQAGSHEIPRLRGRLPRQPAKQSPHPLLPVWQDHLVRTERPRPIHSAMQTDMNELKEEKK